MSFPHKLLSEEQRILFERSMERLDQGWNEEAGMLARSFNGREYHDLRGSCHYALGLLVRNAEGDQERAVRILEKVLNSQYLEDPDMPYYGDFPQDERRPAPPHEPLTDERFDAVSRYYLEKWIEQIRGKMQHHLRDAGYSEEKIGQIEGLARQSVLETVPVVWGNWDANWREFVATELAMILIFGEDKLDPELVQRIEEAACRAVFGSIRRWKDHVVPMNTNVELMHVFICAYYGERLGRQEYLDQAREAARDIAARYDETDSFAEFNSTTYYSVDLQALSTWRLYIRDPEIHEIGCRLEAGLWQNIAEMYHPGLNQVCGPFARNYDNDMALHSMLPAYLYLAFGEEKPFPLFNVETAAYIDAALNGTIVPDTVREQLLHWTGKQFVKKQFRELMERGLPGDDTTLCDVTATIDEDWMMGAMKGSRNTSGQLRSFAAFWKNGDEVLDMMLTRRVPGGREGEHLWTVYFNGTVEDDRLTMDVTPDLDRDLEVVFTIHGTRLSPDCIEKDRWTLPGAVFHVATDAGTPKVITIPNGLEIVYFWKEGSPAMHFELKRLLFSTKP